MTKFTGGSNRRIGDLINEVNEGKLVLRPPFQRRLVWTNVVKEKFLETVIMGYPFPEIFVATGELDRRTTRRVNLLVDGQQRISTLREYVQGSEDLILKVIKPYEMLTPKEQEEFLDYIVAVRDLGNATEDQIKEIFARINSTDYPLKRMEKLNAMFGGEFKTFCEELSLNPFFDKHGVFTLADRRRMSDVTFCVILVTTLMSTYYNRDELNREYLERYNDSFPDKSRLQDEIAVILKFIEQCGFPEKSRVWRKTDLFTLLVELHTILVVNDKKLDAQQVGGRLDGFYKQVGDLFKLGGGSGTGNTSIDPVVFRYLKASTKATNDKYARVDRAEVIEGLLDPSAKGAKKEDSIENSADPNAKLT
jgi:hypothetical protein